MKKEQVLEIIKGYKFLAIDHKEERIVIVMEDVANGFKGFTLSWDNQGYSCNPMFIASTFIKNTESRYDFTNDIDEAFNYLIGWTHVEL